MLNFTIFLVLIAIVSFLLIVVIMVQNPKNGGLSSTFGGAQIGGVQKTNDFLNKSTWTLATVLVALVLLSSLSFSAGNTGGDQDLIDESAVPAAPAKTDAAKPATPAAQPQGAATTPAPAAPAQPQK